VTDESHSSDDFISTLESKGKLGWRAAAEIMEPYGRVAANFSEAIRLMVSHYEAGTATLPLSAQNHILRLLSNNTIKAAYYFITKGYKPDTFAGKSHISSKDLFNAHSPIDHAAILSYAYLFRNLSKKTEQAEWEYVETPLSEALALGGSVGCSIPEVGLAFGLLCRGLRYLAFAAFLRDNRRGFKEYRRHLKQEDLPFDTAFEEKTWGCNNIQVAAIIMERMGFNRQMAFQFVAAAEHDAKSAPDELYGIRFRMAEALIHHYSEEGEVLDNCPAWVGKKFPFSTDARGTLLTKLNQVLPNIEKYEWISKSSTSVNPDSTPELFAQAEAPAATEEKVTPLPDSILEA
jgi:hypothetical protein